MTGDALVYKRARFGTRIPTDRMYSRSHYWLREVEPGLWRVGFTKFATRMLGDVVEYSFEAESGQAVELGAPIGWIEGFKAVSEIYSVAAGQFRRGNADLRGDITLIESEPYEGGWLYEVVGTSDPASVNADGYAAVLDVTIDGMLASRHEGRRDE